MRLNEIEEFLQDLQYTPEIVAISETKITKNSKYNYKIPNYNFIHTDSASNAGGVAFYIKKEPNYNIRNDITLDVSNCESLWIELHSAHTQKLIVGVIYCHPNPKFVDLQENLLHTIANLEKQKVQYIICGDININLLSSNKKSKINQYKTSLSAIGCKCLINEPTRFAKNTTSSLLDHIYTNISPDSTKSGVCISDISDHLPVFILIKKYRTSSKQERKFCRCWKKFDPDSFLLELNKSLESYSIDQNADINDCFIKFMTIYVSILDKMAPYVQLSRKEIKLQQNHGFQKGY